MPNAERRLVSILVGLGVTGLGMLSKVTAALALPGYPVALAVQHFASPPGLFWLTLYAGNFAIWAIAAYLFLGWRRARGPAA